MTLVGYWPMNETSGSTAYDYSGYDNHGTVSSEVSIGASGILGQPAYDFAASGANVNVGDPDNVSFADDLSISFWIKPSEVGSNRDNPIGKAYGGETAMTLETSGDMSCYHGSAGDNSSPYNNTRPPEGTFQNDVWTHFVYVRDTATRTIRLYADGELVTEEIRSISDWEEPTSSTNDLQFGTGYAADNNSTMAEMRFYDRPITHTEVQYLYSVVKGTGDWSSDWRDL